MKYVKTCPIQCVSLLCIGLLMMFVSSSGFCQNQPPALHAAGDLLKTSEGKTVRLQGVNIPSLEWSNTGEHVLKSVGVAMGDWKANVIRLPLAQDRWFGKASGQNDGGKAYRAIVQQVVSAISSHQGYVILDLHWSDMGRWGENIGQHKMPDDNSALFWKSVAKEYANNPAVLFDLYNEPHDVSWDVWKNGGEVTEEVKGTNVTYHSPGMQSLLDTVRAVGAKNLAVVGGLDWAYDLTGVMNGYALSDSDGAGIIYSSHIYPWKRDWEGKVAIAAKKYPVILGEVGCQPDPKQEDPSIWAPKVLAFIEKYQLNWTAWSFHPGASPCLITDFKTYDPTPYWGVYVKKVLSGS